MVIALTWIMQKYHVIRFIALRLLLRASNDHNIPLGATSCGRSGYVIKVVMTILILVLMELVIILCMNGI